MTKGRFLFENPDKETRQGRTAGHSEDRHWRKVTVNSNQDGWELMDEAGG